MESEQDTTTERIRRVLREHPEGLSTSDLRNAVERNSGNFRRARRRMVESGEVTVEVRPHESWGKVHIHKLASGGQIPGQTRMEDDAA